MQLIFKQAIRTKAACASLLALLLTLYFCGPAVAHPLGNFTINRYSKIVAQGHDLHVTYIVDMAEIPAYAEQARIDVDGDGVLSAQEVDAYRTRQSRELIAHLSLQIDGERTPLVLQSADLTFPAGQAGLPTQRMVLQLLAQSAGSGSRSVAFVDGNYADRLGWKEVVVVAGREGAVSQSTVPAQDASRQLTAYPAGLLNSPPQTTQAAFTWQVDGSAAATPALASTTLEPASAGVQSVDAFADLVTIPELGLGAVLLALAAATGWGALHALSPGHGKTLVAAYLVGAQGTVRHALFLGLTTTITHTAGVFALGLATLAFSSLFVAEQIYPWLSAASGLMVVSIGVSMAWSRLRSRPAHAHAHEHMHGGQAEHHHEHGDHEHGHHEHGHHEHGRHEHGRHEHGRHEHGDHDHGHSHLPPGMDGRPVTWRRLLALGVSGGLLPCPSALVLMLGAISLNRAGFGLLLILAFSAGLAGVLTIFGIVLLHAGKLFERLPEGPRLLRLAPAASAVFITLAGLAITAQALAQTGLLRIWSV